jgi:NAD(P)-dependent dehydrogenase (short-subunit alcohol dehydrogenase family)
MPTAIVTGAASGSGRAITEKFAEHDWAVFGLDMDEDGLKMLADEQPLVTPVTCDLADLDAVTDLARIDGFTDADVLVNCAGKLDPGYAGSYGADRYRRTVDSMLTAPMILTDLVLPGMYDRWESGRQPGAIVNIGSFYSLIGGAIKGGYTAAKWGLLGTTKTVGLEAARRTGTGVRTVLIAPPHVDSPLFDPKQIQAEADLLRKPTSERAAQLVGQIPTGVLGTPERVAGAIWWWLTDPAALDITATALDMSGGITAGFPDEAGW